ncbi:MAG: dephospho-CoA kinase [Dissulfurispiraceae bacterium]|jgi:dephospho-CoA kinase|nr:dephospho-CoA kinase [Dissulfurispiraceae bacterium]
MVITGLTGNYGMGKSTVSRMFADLGAKIINTDEIVRELLLQPGVINQISETFGPESVTDGAVNKKELADAVFKFPHLRISLENILHPLVFENVDMQKKGISESDPAAVVVIEAPVIFERGYQNRFDVIITVFTTEDVAIKRLVAKGVSEQEARSRFFSQMPIKEKILKSDFSIDNSSSLDVTKKQVQDIYLRLLSL